MKGILVTGGTGFVGARLLFTLAKQNRRLIAPVRCPNSLKHKVVTAAPVIADLFELANKPELFSECDVVIHVAGLAHLQAGSHNASLEQFRRVNRDATTALAESAAAAGVKRFIFVSSIGVNGISNTVPFRYNDIPRPSEDYAISKSEAELGLLDVANKTGLEVVIIRPPLIYGAGAPGNFGKLIRLTQKGLPLPLGAIHNKRSLVALDNLVDLIVTCIDHPEAVNKTFLVSDDRDLSTTELLTLMIRACGKSPRLLPVPFGWLKFVGKLTGKEAIIERLCGNLQVDISYTKQILGWTPPVTVEQGIAQCFEKEDLC